MNVRKAMNITTAKRGFRLTGRHKLIAGIAAPFVAMLVAAAVIGFTQAATHSMTTHGQTGAYSDCLALASKDGFAPDVCEALDPNSKIATIDCKNDPTLRNNDPNYCKEN